MVTGLLKQFLNKTVTIVTCATALLFVSTAGRSTLLFMGAMATSFSANAGGIDIDRANWNNDRDRLIVRGDDAEDDSTVTIRYGKKKDNGDVIGDEGARFENLIATSLLKRLHYLEDRDGYRYELRYIRDKEGREVDFVIVKDGKIEELIEAKYSDETISRSLVYYAERLKPPKATQIVANLRRPFDKGKVKITDPISYFRSIYTTS